MEHTPISLLVLGLVSILSYICFRQVLKRPRQTSLNACDRRPEEELDKPDKQTPWQDEASQLGHESPAEEALTTRASSHARPALEILYPDQSNKSIEIDIVAVHGLGANVDWSWIHKDGPREIHWLRDSDMLPAQVPQARIIAYNYESKWHSDAPKTRLRLCGEDLIASLASFRADCPNRPLIFIGHSLGGNVVQHGLLYADRESDYRGVVEVTTGLIFLGTPFRGSKMQPLGAFTAALMKPMGSHSGILKSLGYDDVDLRDKLHDFCRLCNRLSLASCCFFELDSTDYGRKAGISGIIKGMCVEEASACITGHDRFSLQTDHFKLNKFAGPGDRSFLLVSSKIKTLADNAAGIMERRRNPREIVTGNDYARTKRPEARNCLRDLFLSDPAEDKQRLKRKKGKRAANTCEWVLATEELTAWLGTGAEPTSRSNVLWLYGNPGTGKSTMALYLADELANVFTQTNGKTLAYFFCDSSIEEQKTATAVVRGLLLQLVQQHPQLLDDILPKYDERGANVFTSFDAVWSMFIKAAVDKKTGVKFCIIDALDECDAASQKTLLQQLEETFKDPESVRNVRFLITSRPYPEIREPLEQFATNADLAAFPQVTKDIDRCIDENVATLEKRKYYTKAVTKQVKKILREKAQGTFLWIGLACKELTDVDSKDAVQCLQDLPQGLPALYGSLLERAMQRPRADKRIVQQILSFVTVARHPLEILELADACEIYQDEDRETRSQFTREAVRSCGLLIVVQDNRLYLLHKSVRDFLIQSRDYIQFDELHSHAALAYRCIDYLIEQYENERRGNPRETDLKSYAVAFWPEHAHLAGSVFKILARQTVFFAVDSEVRESWRGAWNSIHYTWDYVQNQSSLAHVAAQFRLVPLIEYICGQGVHDGPADWDSRDSSGRSPLELSAEAGYVDVTSLLLQKGAQISHEALVAAARSSQNGAATLELFLDQQSDQVVVTEGIVKEAVGNSIHGEKVIKLLLDRWGDQAAITEGIVRTAASCNDEAVIKLLLDRWGDQAAITEGIVRTAASCNDEAVIKLLLDRWGDQAAITEGIIQAASRNGYSGEAVMKLLLDRWGDQVVVTEDIVKAAAGNWRCGEVIIKPLLDRWGDQAAITEGIVRTAASCNDEAVIKLLLDRWGDQAVITEGIVQAASRNGYSGEAVMKLLLDRWGDQVVVTEDIVKAAAGNWRCGEVIIKPLLDRWGDQAAITEGIVRTAASCNDEAVIKLLLDRWGDQAVITEGIVQAASRNRYRGEAVMKLLVNVRGGYDCNILQAASFRGYRGIVQLLLENKVDVNAQDGYFGGALQAASAGGYKQIVKMLVDHGADVNASHNAPTPLLIAAKKGHEEVMCVLLDAGADYRVADNFARATLIYAAIHNHSRVVDVLLGKPGLDINAKDHWGGTAISFAARLGHSEIFQKLATRSNIDLQAKDCFGRTSLWWAQRQGHMDIANALIEYDQPTNGGPRTSQMLPAAEESVKFPRNFSREGYCDVCMASLERPWFGCAACEGGRFAICLECHSLGARCLGESHTLLLREKERRR